MVSSSVSRERRVMGLCLIGSCKIQAVLLYAYMPLASSIPLYRLVKCACPVGRQVPTSCDS